MVNHVFPFVAAEEGTDGDTSGSDLEGIDFEGDSSSVSEDNSSDEADEERYKELEELYGKENPVFQGIKIALDSARRRRKLMKKAILVGMYHDTCANNHIECQWSQEFSG